MAEPQGSYGKSDTSTYRPPPETARRRREFLSGIDAVRTVFGIKPRNTKPQAKYVHKAEKIPHGGSPPRPRKKLTGTISLKDRKKMLAAKLRKAGVRTVGAYFAKRDRYVQRAAAKAKRASAIVAASPAAEVAA